MYIIPMLTLSLCLLNCILTINRVAIGKPKENVVVFNPLSTSIFQPLPKGLVLAGEACNIVN